MKNKFSQKLMIGLLTIIFISCGQRQSRMSSFAETNSSVYICTGSSSYRYHRTSNCSGLNNCQSEIEEVSVSYATSIGRTPCKKCY